MFLPINSLIPIVQVNFEKRTNQPIRSLCSHFVNSGHCIAYEYHEEPPKQYFYKVWYLLVKSILRKCKIKYQPIRSLGRHFEIYMGSSDMMLIEDHHSNIPFRFGAK